MFRAVWMRLSLRQKIASMMLLSMLAVSLVTFFMFRYLAGVAEEEKLEGFKSQAINLSERIAAQFYERYGDVQAFGMNEIFRNGSPAQMAEVLNGYAKIYEIYDLILFVDASGAYVASNTLAPDGSKFAADKLQKVRSRSFADQAWFKAAMAGQFTEDKDKGFLGTYFEDAQIDKVVSEVYGQPMFGTAFSSVVKAADGHVIGVLTARPGFRWVEREVAAVYKQLQSAGLSSSELTVLDQAGFVLVDYDPTLSAGDLSIKRDFDNVIGKLNLAEKGNEAAVALKAGESGGHLASHVRKGIIQAVGYSSVKSSKFIDKIGWGVMVRTSRDELIAGLVKAQMAFLAAVFLCVVLACIIAILFSNRLGRALSEIVSSLRKQGSDLTKAADQVAAASTELSSSSAEQAAALQETVSSLDQVSAMVGKNAENAKQSKEASLVGQDAALRGKNAMEDLRASIDEISQSNTTIAKQIDASNEEIASIVQVIGEIANKTKVINDIVFQTKLLSFNASVEAARAGEHGKGFAVVAEEVGNLAQMSGNAAKEIADMLDASARRVEATVTGTRTKVERLISDGKNKIDTGVATSRRCQQALDEIVQSVTGLGRMVDEIATASSEQALGVQEITRAMGQLDQVTQQNAAASQESSSAANQLNAQAEVLSRIVQALFETVQGSTGSALAHSGGSSVGPDIAGANPGKNGARMTLAKNLPTALHEGSSHQAVEKAAAGAEHLPSEHDPRFSDI